MYYLCTREEERAPDTGLSPLLFARYKGRNTSEIEATVKMRRFAAASIWRLILRGTHMEGGGPRHESGAQRAEYA